MDITIENVGADESWLLVLKKAEAAPSFFYPMTPDDGEVTLAATTLTWSPAQGAESYTVKISQNKNLSDPVVTEAGIKDTSYLVKNKLTAGQRYYWSVEAQNKYGSTSVSQRAAGNSKP
jgi:hypothetical protein